MKRGFTLIELLVVVLIIGILSSVALPQYTLAVEKSRATQALISVKAASESMERYYLENGEYPLDPASSSLKTLDSSLLDIDISPSKYFRYQTHKDIYVSATSLNSSFPYVISKTLRYGSNIPESWRKRGLTCHLSNVSDGTSSKAGKLCKSLCGTSELVAVWGSGNLGCEIK